MEISISKIAELVVCSVNGEPLTGVTDYKITSLDDGKTRLVLTLEFIAEIESTTFIRD